MSASSLRDAIRRLIVAHPDIQPSRAGHAPYIERYRTTRGANIGLETRGVKHQNVYVETQHVDLSALGDILHKPYLAADYGHTKPNHNLFHIDAFRHVDIVRFQLTELDQAKRVLAELMR